MTNSPSLASADTLPFASSYHTPIMVDQVIEGLHIRPGFTYIDATAGGGGHSQALLETGVSVIALDQDDQAIAFMTHRLAAYCNSGQLQIIKTNFAQADQVLPDPALPVGGILADLGVSSHQLDADDRGFNFNADNLDMRMDQQLPVTAAQVLNTLGTKDLARLLADLGEERYATHFAKVISQRRQTEPITSAKVLANLLYQASPPPYRRGPIHPATRTFQALRLAVNAELDSLTTALPLFTNMLAPTGRLVIVSFHSLEDRLVKQYMASQPNLTALTKKPILASDHEQSLNPRSRSAKLRVAVKGEASA